jgi:uncharacterized membrane protein
MLNAWAKRFIKDSDVCFILEIGTCMRGLTVFVAFFSIFLVSSLAIPSPLFPGSVICLAFGMDENIWIACALANGLVYGFIVWLVYCVVFRWVESVSEKTLGKDKKS